MDTYTIKVTGDHTSVPPYEKLDLGTYGSYGIKQLKFELDDLWKSMDAVDATFHNTPGDEGTTMLLDASGVIKVPPEATAQATEKGTITLRGVKPDVQAITVDIKYRCKDRAAVPGKDSTPTPNEWEQFVEEVKQYSDVAAESADRAEENSEKAEEMAAAAASSASDSAQSAQAAAASEQNAAESAKSAEKSANLAQQGIQNAGWIDVYGEDGILYMVRSDNAPEDFRLVDNGKGVLEAIYG